MDAVGRKAYRHEHKHGVQRLVGATHVHVDVMHDLVYGFYMKAQEKSSVSELTTQAIQHVQHHRHCQQWIDGWSSRAVDMLPHSCVVVVLKVLCFVSFASSCHVLCVMSCHIMLFL